MNELHQAKEDTSRQLRENTRALKDATAELVNLCDDVTRQMKSLVTATKASRFVIFLCSSTIEVQLMKSVILFSDGFWIDTKVRDLRRRLLKSLLCLHFMLIVDWISQIVLLTSMFD